MQQMKYVTVRTVIWDIEMNVVVRIRGTCLGVERGPVLRYGTEPGVRVLVWNGTWNGIRDGIRDGI